MQSSREKILARIREAKKIPSHLSDLPDNTDNNIKEKLASVTPKTTEDLWTQFQKELELVNGEFHFMKKVDDIICLFCDIMKESDYSSFAITGDDFCKRISEGLKDENPDLNAVMANEIDMTKRKDTLASIPVAVVTASHAIADIASLALIYDDTPSTLSYFLSDCILLIIKKEQIKANMFELFAAEKKDRLKNMILITGPSRTADIEKVLVLGAHGPRRLVVCMLDE